MTKREMLREGVAGALISAAAVAVLCLFWHALPAVHAEIIPASGGGASATPTADGTKLNTSMNNSASTALNGPINTGAGTALSLNAVASAQGASSIAGTAAGITASDAIAGSSNAGAAAGGTATITAGSAARLTSGNAAGGDVVAKLGAGIGTGNPGNLLVKDGSGVTILTLDIITAATATFNSSTLAFKSEGGLNNLVLDNGAGRATFTTNGGVYIDNTTAAISPFVVKDNGAAVFTIKDNGLPLYGGSTPAVSNTTANSCGTTAASLAGNESVGTITVGATAGTSCTITFATAEVTRRNCHCEDETDATFSSYVRLSATTGKCTGTFAAGALVTYICLTY